jgi:adenylate kinase
MRIIVTGTPGVGKSSIAKALGKRLHYRVVNEKDFAVQHGIGKWDEKEEELVIPLARFGKELSELLQKEKNVILEGHLLCELRLPADFVVLVTIDPEALEARLRLRGYGEEKVQDNVFCEGIDYCKKHLLKSYPEEKIVEVQGGKSIKETLDRIIQGLKEKGAVL